MTTPCQTLQNGHGTNAKLSQKLLLKEKTGIIFAVEHLMAYLAKPGDSRTGQSLYIQ